MIINPHSGFLPLFRGMNVIEWSLIYGFIPYTTIHFINTGIDTGKIAGAKLITLQPADNEQTIAWKTIKVGTQLMLETVDKWKLGTLYLKEQKQFGRLYKMNEFDPAAILKVKNMVESGELKLQIEKVIS